MTYPSPFIHAPRGVCARTRVGEAVRRLPACVRAFVDLDSDGRPAANGGAGLTRYPRAR